MATNSPADVEAELRRIGRRRTRQIARLTDTEAELALAIREADRQGIPRIQIGRAAGVVRATVYNVLGREESGS